MRNINYNINIDKLEICCIASKENVDLLEDTLSWEFDSFRISSNENIERNNIYESYFNIDILYTNKDDNKSLSWVNYATLKIGNTFEQSDNSYRYVWIKLNNEVLYTEFLNKINILVFLDYIIDSLNLKFNNITKLDISIDTNINMFSKIKRAIRNEKYIPIVLGKSYENMNTIINRIGYYHTADRRRYRTSTININNRDKDMCLSCYNKSQEINDNRKKEYIYKWNKSKSMIYRIEVRLKKKAIKDYLERRKLSFYDIYIGINNRELLFDIFMFFSNRLIRFSQNGKIYSILEI